MAVPFFRPAIDRFDLGGARRVCAALWSDEVFAPIARRLADSAAFAHAIAPASWAVTLGNGYLRLNVGPVEVATFTPDLFRLLTVRLSGPAGPGTRWTDDGRPAYVSVPVASGVLSGPPAALAGVGPAALDAHRGYIREAATRVARTPYRRSHSPAVLELVEAVLGERLPRPGWAEAAAVAVPLAEELPAGGYWEGARCLVAVNIYERDPAARAACLTAHGTACVVCGFCFGDAYGPVGEGFIHVHHLTPLAAVGEAYQVDPVADLRPVCPNCHAMIHRRTPPYHIDEVRSLLRR